MIESAPTSPSASSPTSLPGSPWGDRPLPDPGQTLSLHVGPVTVWVRRVKNEVWIAHHHADEGVSLAGDAGAASDANAVADDEAAGNAETATDTDAAPPGVADWSRWALREGEEPVLRLSPALPDRMMVVKVAQPFTLLSRAEARIYTRVGAWIRIELVGAAGTWRLTEIPTERLSDTWWGDFLGGETAYWLATKARRELTDDLFVPWRIMCTLQLVNGSPDNLAVEKLGLRVEHLSVFEKDGRLWAEETRIAYRGEAEGSDIQMRDLPPREAEGARELTPARTQSTGFRARTFAKLRSLSPFGIGG